MYIAQFVRLIYSYSLARADPSCTRPDHTWDCDLSIIESTQIAKFMGPTWVPPGSYRPQMGPMLAPWILLSGYICPSIQAPNRARSSACEVQTTKYFLSNVWLLVDNKLNLAYWRHLTSVYLVIIGSGNDMSPVWSQASCDLGSVGPFGTNFKTE